MEAKIKIEGLKEAQKYFQSRPRAFKRAIKDILWVAVLSIERGAKLSPNMRVDTGRMRASIGGGSFAGGSFAQRPDATPNPPHFEQAGIKLDEGAMRASIGPTVAYAKHVHEKYPFMVDAMNSAIPIIKVKSGEIIKRAINVR